MSARYAIDWEVGRNLLTVDLAGLFQVEDVVRYMTELRQVMIQHAVKQGYCIIVDVSGCTVQPQPMIVAMGKQMAQMPKASAIAIVAQSALARMQIKRLFDQPYARICADRAEAEAWVVDGREP